MGFINDLVTQNVSSSCDHLLLEGCILERCESGDETSVTYKTDLSLEKLHKAFAFKMQVARHMAPRGMLAISSSAIYYDEFTENESATTKLVETLVDLVERYDREGRRLLITLISGSAIDDGPKTIHGMLPLNKRFFSNYTREANREPLQRDFTYDINAAKEARISAHR